MDTHDNSIIALPAGFSILTNAGLNGDMQIFEMGDHQMTTGEPRCWGDNEHFVYQCHDSDEGSVTITYQAHSACGADGDGAWDVIITTGSDVWGLAESASAVSDAVALHKALGRDKAHRE